MTKATAKQAVEAVVSAFVNQVGGWAHTASFDNDEGSDGSGDEASEAAKDQGRETDSDTNGNDEADDMVDEADFW